MRELLKAITDAMGAEHDPARYAALLGAWLATYDQLTLRMLDELGAGYAAAAA